ncbi:mucin-4-like isoform X7 [Strigops habroptila]|uniref:mucin-4-like isoform X7 n=1 Tax=Strigops habroptila TaxID=2489341 RepID=UPI001401D3C5|nr:mucin-4-like isoform X7 [Strigops habroptila]
MGTRGWTLSTFVGCCIWILHGLGAAAALPFTTEGPFSAGTASPITAESKGPSALVVGTAETSTVAADAETVETTLMESPPSPTFPPGAEPDAVVTGASKYTSTAPTWTNVTKPLNTSQDFERGLTAPAAATTAAAISAQHPTITPEAELDVTAAAPGTPLGTTPLFAGMKEDIAAVAREGEDLNPSTAAKSLPTIPPPAAAWEAQPTAGSPVGAGVTMLPSQGLTTAAGAVEEGVTLPLDIQSKDSANSSSPSPSTGGLLTAQQDRAVSGAVGITPEPVGEITPAAEGSPSASVPGDAGDAVNGEFSPPASTFLPLESPTASGTVGNLWEPSVLPDQAVLSPTTLLAPAGSEDWEGQGAPGSALSPAASEAPKATEDTAISLLSPGVPTDVLSDTNPPVLATALPRGDMGAVRLAKPSPWQTPTGEQPPLLAAALPFPSAPGAPYPPLGTAYPLPGAAYPPPGTGAGTLPAADDGAETPASPDLSAARGAPMSPSLGGTQPLETAAGAPQDADGARLNSASDAPNPASFVPDGLAWPAAGVQDEGAEGAGDTAQSGGSGNGSPYSDTQTDTNPSAFSVQQDPANTGELPTGGTEALANAKLSPLSALGDGAGAEPALGQGPLPGPAPPGSAGLEPGVLEAEGPGGSAPVAAYPPPGAAAGPVSGSETPASPDLSAGEPQGAPVPPSFGESQPLGMAAGAPQGAGLPGANGSSTSLTSAWDAPSSAAYGPAGPSSPALGVQAGTNVGLPTAEEHGAGPAEQALGGAGSGAGFEPPLVSAAGSGTVAGKDQLPGAGSSSGPASPSGAVAASSVLDPSSPSSSGPWPPSLGAGPGVPPAAGEGAGEAAGDRGSSGQSQAPAREGPAASGAPDGEMSTVLQFASSSPSIEGSSSPGTAVEAANGASLPGAGGAGGALSTALGAPGPEERPVPAPGIQSGASPGLSDAQLSQANVVELPGGSSVNGGPSPGASLGEGAGAIMQKTSGAPAPSALPSPQETQPLVPVAPDSSSISNDMATSPAASLPLSGHGLSSGLAPNGDSISAPGTQSGSRPLMPGAQRGLAGDAGGAQTWSFEDEVASGMPAPLGEVSPRAPASPGAALELPSAPQRENAAEGVSTNPGLSAPLLACESVVGSSAGRRGELVAAALGGPALLLPPRQPGSPGAPSGDADISVPEEASAMLPGAMAGRGDMAWLLPSTTGARVDVEITTHSLLGGSPGVPALPPPGITAGSPTSKTPRLGPAGSSSPAAVQPLLGSELTTSLVNQAPVTGGSSIPTAFPGQGGAWGRSPATTRTATTSLAPPVPIPGGRETFPRPEAATVISRASSPVFPAPSEGPAAALTPLPGPAVAAVPLYQYGARENDRQYVERRVDFNSPLFKPETGFPFGKTLRDSLYFTDNGQIIFPASDNSIFTYPNPPPSGFNGHEEVPIIAVFWDNADFSRGVGTTYYQEYFTLNTAKPPFVRDVEAKVRRYLKSSYSAVWTLKITWERAPAYTARTDTHRTITYQAVLTTDGFRSYVLMLYQEGGMQWDYTRLAATNVLIGYTSGDGFYHNDDLTQRPPATKYRPDQFRGYNTDLRGLWIYKLESRVGVNYRLKCLAWTGRQQEPRAWTQGLPACPCSLQQGQQDPRFKSSRGGWWAARVSMLHSASPNQHGAGIRCLYDSQSQLIEGRQERYWRSFRQTSPYRDQELKFYDWCCNQAGSAHLCARYSEKRPKIGCGGYQLPGMAGSSEESESYSEEQRGGEDE